MADETRTDDNSKSYEPPKGTRTVHECVTRSGERIPYTAHADWIALREREQPVAEMFHVFYAVDAERDGSRPIASGSRPITFVFNGGPGAAAAYLHMGGLGPKRVYFNADGSAPPAPARLVDNEDCWLSFTDLVFVDPIGTGFSRTVEPDKSASSDHASQGADAGSSKKTGLSAREKQFYQLDRDLNSLCEFISRFLSRHRRWSSPVFIAGESYGGYRVAKLARRLQEDKGVGLCGAIIISPALEWYLLESSDYDVLFWSNAFPSMVLTAVFHGKSRAFDKNTPAVDIRAAAEAFASGDLILYLAQGNAMDADRRARIAARMADMLGISQAFVTRHRGRISPFAFARELLAEGHRYCGIYDGTITCVDPFPNRETFQGPDPTLASIGRLFTSGVQAQLRGTLGVESERDYHLLNFEANAAWKRDEQQHAFATYVGSVDDLRYALSLNPHMQVMISHGWYDLITPYYASDRIVNLMNLDDSVRANVHVQHFGGGHMFYSWAESRRQFTDAMRSFYVSAQPAVKA